MKKIFLFLILTFSISITAYCQEKKPKLIASCETRGCSGSEYCSACKNCSGCKHCAKEGGTCGVCSAPVKKKSVLAKPKMKTKKRK